MIDNGYSSSWGAVLRPIDASYAKLTMAAPLASSNPSILEPSIRMLRLPDVMDRVGLKRAAIYQHIAKGSFPKQISLGTRAVGWLEHEIDAWLAARVSSTRAEQKI